MKVARAKNGDVLIRLTEEQAMDLFTLVGSIGGARPNSKGELLGRQRTTDPLYHHLQETLNFQRFGEFNRFRQLATERWYGANVYSLTPR